MTKYLLNLYRREADELNYLKEEHLKKRDALLQQVNGLQEILDDKGDKSVLEKGIEDLEALEFSSNAQQSTRDSLKFMQANLKEDILKIKMNIRALQDVSQAKTIEMKTDMKAVGYLAKQCQKYEFMIVDSVHKRKNWRVRTSLWSHRMTPNSKTN